MVSSMLVHNGEKGGLGREAKAKAFARSNWPKMNMIFFVFMTPSFQTLHYVSYFLVDFEIFSITPRIATRVLIS